MRQFFKRFIQLESASSVLLLFMAVFAMFWANSPWRSGYQTFNSLFLFWINECLMAVFFLSVGLELKRGVKEGSLSSMSTALLPLVAALGGMIMPALVYFGFNQQDPLTLHGWAIPVATDIAFALGVLSLFGSRIPHAAKLFLLALAVFDDLGAILIIALFYTSQLSFLWLCVSIVVSLVLFAMNGLSVRNVALYLLVGVGLWYALLKTGIHPTIAGVILAFAMPVEHHFEQKLSPWVVYFIMPVFALANAGVSLAGVTPSILMSSVVLGVAFGLWVGKQTGVLSSVWLMQRFRLAKLPTGVSWTMMYGIALLCGIGFTMSLFLGTLSFQGSDASYLTEMRLGVILGSILSGLTGAVMLFWALRKKEKRR